MTQDEEWLLKEKYNGEKSPTFFVDCERLKNGEPLAYIIGHIPFLGTTIYLDSHPLIPRPETEYWVEKVINEISARGKSSGRMLDLCAGSGCIGVALLKAIPNSTVDFVEIDEAHHSTILKNIHENDIAPKQVHIIGGDLFEKVHSTYDCILSNPPYIDKELERTEESVTLHEPHLALWGGRDGMEIIERILIDAPKHLIPRGVLYIEHEPEQAEAAAAIAKSHNFASAIPLPDQYGVVRYTRLTRAD